MNSLRKICSKCFLNGLCMCLHEAASLLLVIPHGNSQKSYLLHTFYCCVMLMINTHLRNQCCSVLFETAFGWYVWYMHGNTSWDAFVVCFVWADERKVIPCHSCGTRLPQVETHFPRVVSGCPSCGERFFHERTATSTDPMSKLSLLGFLHVLLTCNLLGCQDGVVYSTLEDALKAVCDGSSCVASCKCCLETEYAFAEACISAFVDMTSKATSTVAKIKKSLQKIQGTWVWWYVFMIWPEKSLEWSMI